MMLLLVLLVSTAVTAVSAQTPIRFLLYGGSMTFYPLGRSPDGTFEVELRIKAAATMCIMASVIENATVCDRGDCGNQNSSIATVIDTSRERCLQEVVTTRVLAGNRPFVISFAPNNSFWFYYNWTSPFPFTMTAQVDLGIRSDTGESNTSPLTTIIHVLRIYPNCPGTVNFTAFDPDGDRVRCSFEEPPNCGPCLNQPPGFFLDQTNCLLTYNLTGIVSQSDLAFELILEDFPREQITLTFSDGSSRIVPTTEALSRVPLQFSVFVEPDAPSCCAGEFIPLIVSPTPSNGAYLPVLAGVPLEIRVKALSRRRRFLDLQISGPSGIRKTRISSQMHVITWIPTANEVNRQFPICFIVETQVNSLTETSRFQSKLRCVIADVRPDPTTTAATTTAVPSDATGTTIATTAATTTSTFCRGRPSGLFGNPADPGSFFQCHFGITYLLRCPAGLVFSAVCKCCDFPRDDVPSSRFCEGRADGIFENEDDSNTFHHCSNGITITQQCPGNLVYGDGCNGCERPY